MGFEQPHLVKDDPARGKGGGLDGLQKSFPTQTILWFYVSVLLIMGNTTGAEVAISYIVSCTPRELPSFGYLNKIQEIWGRKIRTESVFLAHWVLREPSEF